MQKYEMAWRTFQLKYNCLAGDCADASSLFTGAVNGNGNGIINIWTNWGTVESLQTWNQWSSAGLINGKYSSGTGFPAITLGTTSPATRINPNIGYTLYSDIGSVSRQDYVYYLQIGALGIVNPTWNDFLWGSGFNATQAYDIDKKIDDGLPSTGKFTGTNSAAGNTGVPEPSAINSNTTCLSSSNYKLDTLNTGCTMYYQIAQ